MRMKTLIALAIVTVPTVALALLLPAAPGGTDHSSSASPAQSGSALLPGLKGHTDALARLDVTGPSGTASLARTPVAAKPAEGWTLRGKGGYPVPTETIRPILDLLLALHGVEPRTTNPSLYARLDLGEPGPGSQSRLVTFGDANGHPLGEIVLGKIKATGSAGAAGQIYARLPGTHQTWRAAPAVNLPTDPLDWLNRTIVDFDEDTVKEVVLTQPGSAPLDFSREHPADKLAIRGLPATVKLKSDTPGADVQDAFSALQFDDVKPASQINGSQAGTVHLVTFDGAMVDFALRKDNGQTWATLSASGSKAAQDIAAKTKGWAYEIPADRATPMLTNLAGLVQAPATK